MHRGKKDQASKSLGGAASPKVDLETGFDDPKISSAFGMM
jgi:hypothetical protein